ncbi:hypothetical protein [Sphingomonas ginsenosidivorax]|nr:hypothetical protein [Sphingomonas ginsenosidivorax]
MDDLSIDDRSDLKEIDVKRMKRYVLERSLGMTTRDRPVIFLQMLDMHG